jgi:two-component system sensor histidine kinase/response regulator
MEKCEKPPLILIVDDEPGARKTLQGLLLREGYELTFAASGPEALARLEGLEPGVILLDVMMPGMDGFEVCQRLKTDERWRHIPVILVTALDSKEDLVRGLDAGADDFLSKPVNGLELRARVRSMLRIRKQYDELEATLRLREDMANMIVHDMRNYLMPILGFSQLLKRKITAPDVLKDVEVIWDHARRLQSFLNDMLVLAKVEAGKPVLNRSLVDVNRLVLEVEKSYSVVARARGINLVVELPGESRQTSLDSNLFQRVLDNLVSNALKFSPAESTVTLRAEYPGAGTGLRIQVLDEGPGIPEEHRERIFDKFEIVALSRDVSQVGLGLAFCKMAVEAHGGRIFVDANEPRGAVFTVEI